MFISRSALLLLLTFAIFTVAGCAIFQRCEPVQVIMAGVEPLQGQELELRMLVKLRIQNPNDQPVNYNGVSVQMDVQGKRFATGVSDASGSIPRYGETVVSVPVSVSTFQIVRQAIGIMTGEKAGKLAYELSGNLAGAASSCGHFESKGEFTLPAGTFESGQ
jgi:LEA14-like dessication related protein